VGEGEDVPPCDPLVVEVEATVPWLPPAQPANASKMLRKATTERTRTDKRDAKCMLWRLSKHLLWLHQSFARILVGNPLFAR
jgi:hypothetical protein